MVSEFYTSKTQPNTDLVSKVRLDEISFVDWRRVYDKSTFEVDNSTWGRKVLDVLKDYNTTVSMAVHT